MRRDSAWLLLAVLLVLLAGCMSWAVPCSRPGACDVTPDSAADTTRRGR